MKLYSLPKETMQGVIAFHATILKCIAERMGVKEWRGEYIENAAVLGDSEDHTG